MMMNFRQEFDLAEGRVVVQALTVPLIEQTAELLAASFVATAAQLAPYASYVRRNIVRYLREHQALAPDAMVLVAVLQPAAEAAASGGEGGWEAAADEDEEAPTGAAAVRRPGAEAPQVYEPSSNGAAAPAAPGSVLSGTRPRVIGSAEISFRSATRSSQPFLAEPERCCYLCNMAVSPVFRRRGVATRLLGAAERIAMEVMRESEMYLHLRFVDKEAAALYERAGFYPQAEHWPIAPLLGIQRMKLMRKDLGY